MKKKLKFFFERLNFAFQGLNDDIDSRFEVEMESAVMTITNNNGHVVIVGSLRSLRVNDTVMDLPKDK